MWVVRLAAVGFIATSAAWFLNEVLVWQLDRHASKPAATVGAKLAQPTSSPPQPRPVAPEAIVEHPPETESTLPPSVQKSVAKAATPPSRKKNRETSRSKADTAHTEARSAPQKPKVRVFTVDKQKLQSRFQKPSDTSGHGHVVPHWIDGQRRGMQFADVAPGGIFARLGIQSGDVVMSVNGIEITTQQKALSDLEKLRKERAFDVVLQRDGQERRHRYLIK